MAREDLQREVRRLHDLIVAGDQARFSEIFARRGLTVDFGGTFRKASIWRRGVDNLLY